MTNKDKIILAVAVVMPFGVTALGIWKAYELIKGKVNEKGFKLSNLDPRGFVGYPRIVRNKNTDQAQGQQNNESSEERHDSGIRRQRLHDSETETEEATDQGNQDY